MCGKNRGPTVLLLSTGTIWGMECSIATYHLLPIKVCRDSRLRIEALRRHFERFASPVTTSTGESIDRYSCRTMGVYRQIFFVAGVRLCDVLDFPRTHSLHRLACQVRYMTYEYKRDLLFPSAMMVVTSECFSTPSPSVLLHKVRRFSGSRVHG